MRDADYLIEKAEQCFQLAAFARGHVLSLEIAKGIDDLGEQLMNKAVEIDTARQRTETACALLRDGDWYLIRGGRRTKLAISGPANAPSHLRK